MLLGGDEFGRTQRGNNNAYCQDNETSWSDWKQVEVGEGRELRPLSAKAHCATPGAYRVALASLPARPGRAGAGHLRHRLVRSERREQVSNDSWNNPEKRRLCLRRAARNADGTVSILTAFFNPTAEDHIFRLPPPGLPARLSDRQRAARAPESAT